MVLKREGAGVFPCLDGNHRCSMDNMGKDAVCLLPGIFNEAGVCTGCYSSVSILFNLDDPDFVWHALLAEWGKVEPVAIG